MWPVVFFRRIVGDSMRPKLPPGQLVAATSLFRRLHPGQVIIVRHNGKEKIKRIEQVQADRLFVIGDNLSASTDSRQFGWLDVAEVAGRVIWPRKLAK